VTCLESLFILFRIESCSSSRAVAEPERPLVLAPLLLPVVLPLLACSSAVLMMVGSLVVVLVPVAGLVVVVVTGFVTRLERRLRRCALASMKQSPTVKRTISTNKR
jgi:hypothetical protein